MARSPINLEDFLHGDHSASAELVVVLAFLSVVIGPTLTYSSHQLLWIYQGPPQSKGSVERLINEAASILVGVYSSLSELTIVVGEFVIDKGRL